METPQVFRLTLANLHQLGSLTKYTATPLNPALLQSYQQQEKRYEYQSSIDKNYEYSLTTTSGAPSTGKRYTNSSSFRFNIESNDAYAHRGSYVALRTFYAFGARSGLASSCNPMRRSHSLCNRGRVNKPARDTSVSDTFSSFPTRRSVTPNIFDICPPSSSRTLFSDEKRLERNHDTTKRLSTSQYVSRRGFTETSSRFRPFVWNFTNQKTIRNVEDIDTPLASLNITEQKEIQMLREKNKALEAEIRLLREKLEGQKRTETELRKRIEESDATANKWKLKYEQQRLSTEKKIAKENNNNDIPEDLIEQLDSAAEKLARMSATKDFKMLQNEIENALKEMQCRPVRT